MQIGALRSPRCAAYNGGMKAYVYQDRIALDALTVVERPEPVLGPLDIALKMRAVSLNYRDLAIARGGYHASVAPPLVPLSDGAGEVVAIGPQVTRFRVGDLACPTYLPGWIDGPLQASYARGGRGGPADGVFAELVCVDEQAAVRAPSHLDAVEACTLPVAAVTAWQVLYQTCAVRPGETVLVLGSGGVSIAALQLARAGGARVIVVTRTGRHEARLRALGASDVIALGDTPDWPGQVRARTDGRGVDVAIDVVGGASLSRTIAATRLGAHVHVVGYVGATSSTLDIFEAIRHGATIHAATAGSRTSFEAMNRALELHAVRPVVDRVVPVARWADAFAQLGAGGQLGKIVIELT